MKTIKKLLALLPLIAVLVGCGQNYSNGSRIGTISKFSNKGLVMKSWEGELNVGGFRNATDHEGRTQVVANIFAFSVESPEVVKKVQEAMKSGKPVELVYRQWFVSPPSIETVYVITDMKPVEH